MMRRKLVGIVLLGILGFGLYWLTQMYSSAKGIKADRIPLESLSQQEKLQNGDLIFQTSQSGQSKAIQLATGSQYSHMGIVYKLNGKYWVYEAIQPVTLTPLSTWINRGVGGHYVVKRLKEARTLLTPEVLKKMKAIGAKYKGKHYDIHFEWSDEKMYCSELVWKIYKEAVHVEVGALEKLSDFDLSHEIVQQKMKERYGDQIPMNEKVISPAAMFASDLLITVVKQ